MTTNIFEKATRTKLRIQVPNGRGFVNGTVEDLWDLPVRKLKVMAEERYQALRQAQDTLFGAVRSNPKTELALDVLKHIIEVKEKESKAATTRDIRAEEKRKLREAIAKKQEAQFEEKSMETLQAELAAMESAEEE